MRGQGGGRAELLRWMVVRLSMEDRVCDLRDEIHPVIYGETLWGLKETSSRVRSGFGQIRSVDKAPGQR